MPIDTVIRQFSRRRDHTKKARLEEMVISAAQVRAARALVGWTQAKLAAKSGLSEIGIQNIEKGATDPRASTLAAIKRALEAAGVEFTNGRPPGVRTNATSWYLERWDRDGRDAKWYLLDFGSLRALIQEVRQVAPDEIVRVRVPASATIDELDELGRLGIERL
jgi:transcriptional regulator with XRE-family HTH domain